MDISETGIIIKHNGKEIVLDLADHIEMDIQVWNIPDSLVQCPIGCVKKRVILKKP